MKRRKFVKDALTGEVHSIQHLSPRIINYSIKVDGKTENVPVRVDFSEHCYTRSRKEGDPEEAVILSEPRKDKTTDERVFCLDRWNFSLQLPTILEELRDRMCFVGNSSEVFYRQEDAPAPGDRAGWYICMRFDYRAKWNEMRISVRSCHWRTNRPIEVRGPNKRFYMIFAAYYKKKRS